MIQKYPDGTSYANCENAEQHFTFRINSYEELWHLTQIVDAFNSTSQIPTITIPNLIDAQADRRFGYRQSNGLKLVCKHLNSLKARFKIFHPHNPEVVESLMDNVEIIDNSEFITTVLSKLNDKDISPVILLPDGGAYKWGVKLADKLGLKLDIIAAAKNRKLVDGKSILTQQLADYNFEGKDIILIDDINIYGGTFKGLSKLLRERNCGNLYLAVSHMTVQNLGEDPVTNYFDKVFTTNSKYEEYDVPTSVHWDGDAPQNLEIIKMF